jgi:hypothetical protein
MVQILPRGTKVWARCTVSSRKDGPPLREQNCLGTTAPDAVLVKPCRRRPSPAASTRAQ